MEVQDCMNFKDGLRDENTTPRKLEVLSFIRRMPSCMFSRAGIWTKNNERKRVLTFIK